MIAPRRDKSVRAIWGEFTASAQPCGCAFSAFCDVPTLKHHLHLHPHAANAAVCEIAIQETPRRSAIYAHLRDLDKLWVIECVQRFPAKLQPSGLSQRNRLRQVQI